MSPEHRRRGGLRRSTTPRRLARQADPRLRALLLGTIGSIVASRANYRAGAAKPRPEWIAEYEQACAEARVLAAETLRGADLGPDASLQLIGALAAVHDLNHVGQLARVIGGRYAEAVGPWKAYRDEQLEHGAVEQGDEADER